MNTSRKGKALRRAAAKAFQSNILVSLSGKQKSFDAFDYAEDASQTQVDFVCDECCLPLKLYGENSIENYTDGRANILRSLCDLHAAEWEVNS